jgi:hypothetical protein
MTDAELLAAITSIVKNATNQSDYNAKVAEAIANNASAVIAALALRMPPVVTPATPSPDGTVVIGTNGSLIDSTGASRAITSGGQISKTVGSTATTDAVTSKVVSIGIKGGVFWQLNTSGDYYPELAAGGWGKATKTAPMPGMAVSTPSPAPAPSPSPTPVPAQPSTSGSPVCGLSGYKLTLEHTFGPGGTIPDIATLKTLYDPGFPWGRINGELQRYTNFADANIQIVGNELRLIATPTRGMGFDQIDSAEIVSKTPWQIPGQGIIEFTYKAPSGLGMFPANWLYPVTPTDACEIDVSENVFNNPDGSRDTMKKVFVNDHPGSDPVVEKPGSLLDKWGSFTPGFDFSQGFHTAACQFDGNDKIRWVDQTKVVTRTWRWTSGNQPRIVVDLACGSDNSVTDWPGQPNAASFKNGANVMALTAIRCWSK